MDGTSLSNMGPAPNAVAGPSSQAPTQSQTQAPPSVNALNTFAMPATPPQRALKTVSLSSAKPKIATTPARYPQRERRRAAMAASTVIENLASGGSLTTNGTHPSTSANASNAHNLAQPRTSSFKIKINPNVANKAGLYKILMGGYDRSLDPDPEEGIMFEEQFVLRVPEEVALGDPSKGEKGLAELVNAKRGIPGVSIKFKDQRRATFTFNNKSYSAKLMDLPTIIEGQKTMDKKRLFKVADICQILVVDRPIQSEQDLKPPTGDPNEYAWPHGLTPPLQHVRRRRFRKREIRLDPVGDAVEKLLRAEAESVECKFSLHPGFPPNHRRAATGRSVNGSEAGDPNDEETKSAYGYGSTPGTPFESGALTPGGGAAEEEDDSRSAVGTEADDGERALADIFNNANVDDDEGGAARRDTDGDDDDEDEDDEDLFGDKELIGDEDEDEDDAEEDVDEELQEWKASLRMIDDELKDTRYAMERKRSSLTNPLLAARDKQLQDLTSRVARFERERGELVGKIEARQAIRDEALEAIKEQRAAEQAARNAKIAQEAAERAGHPARSSSGTAGKSSEVAAVPDQEMDDNDEDAEGEEDDDDLFGENGEDDVDMDASEQVPEGEPASPATSDGSSPAQPLATASTVPDEPAMAEESASEPEAAVAPARKEWGFDLDEEEEEY